MSISENKFDFSLPCKRLCWTVLMATRPLSFYMEDPVSKQNFRSAEAQIFWVICRAAYRVLSFVDSSKASFSY
jgi:hypothetical protein